MELLVNNEFARIHYLGNLSILKLSLFNVEIAIDDWRNNWDTAIEYMNALNLKKIEIDATSFTSIADFLYMYEGLIQIMARQTKSPKLWVAAVLNKDCLNTAKPNAKLSPQYNQHDEIELGLFNDFDSSLKWLVLNGKGGDGIFSRLIRKLIAPKKTTVEEVFVVLDKLHGSAPTDPVSKWLRQTQIEEFKKRNG